MKKLTLISSLLIFVVVYANSQKLADKYIKGSIYLNNGTVIQGYIFFDLLNVESFQKSVSYFTDSIYETVKATDKLRLKNVEDVKPKEAKYFELADGKKFISLKYADMTAAGAGSIPSYHFFQEIVAGKISLYRKYNPAVTLTSDEATNAKAREWVLDNYELLNQTADKVTKNIANIAIPDYISDNAEVLARFNNDQYGDLLKVFKRKMKVGEIKHPQYEKDFIKLLTDYNQ